MAADILWVYVTAPSMDVARVLGKMLVEKRLAACVNLLGGMESMYWWNDAVQSEDEAILIAKTHASRYAEFEAALVDAHPYECPCIVALPVQSGFEPFLAWIQSETRP